jgi:hypothetical protein
MPLENLAIQAVRLQLFAAFVRSCLQHAQQTFCGTYSVGLHGLLWRASKASLYPSNAVHMGAMLAVIRHVSVRAQYSYLVASFVKQMIAVRNQESLLG